MNEIIPRQPPRRPGRPSTKVDALCAFCGQAFKAHPSEIARGAGRYCSEECRDNGRAKGIAATSTKGRQPPVERRCEVCGNSFFVYPYRASAARPARYCSNACRKAPPIMKPSR